MSTPSRLIAVPVIVLSLLLVGCRKKASEEIDFGAFNKSVYTNSYFGVTVTVPPDWSIQDRQTQEQLTKVGSEMVAGNDKNLKAALKATEMETVNLFAVFKLPLGSPVPFNCSIMGLAERVTGMPGIQRGRDYHFQVKKTLESSQMQVTFPKEAYTQRLGGVEFDVLEQQMTMRGLTIKQKYFTIIKKGYALSFVLSYTTEAEEVPLRKALETLSFD